MNSQERKERPVALGFLTYFPDAIMETSNHSFLANEKHNPDTPVHWDKSKSHDNLDSLVRHIIDYQKGERYDADGLKILTAISWRAMAFVQIELEKEQDIREVFNPDNWEEVNGFYIEKGKCSKCSSPYTCEVGNDRYCQNHFNEYYMNLQN